MTNGWTAGNADEDTTGTRGWLVGHFIDPAEGGPRATGDVEVKWANHPAGDKRPGWTSDDQRTTLVVLVSGEFRVDLTEGGKVLSRQGDYIMWGAGIDHSWEALADSVVVTVRWPSST
ncbi:signal peptidase I [Actinokineospora sp. NPDC004072]